MTPNILNPRVQACIAISLLLMLAGVMFLPAYVPTFKVDSDAKQLLGTLATVAVSFYLGSSSSSARKDERAADLTAQIVAANPTQAGPAIPPSQQ